MNTKEQVLAAFTNEMDKLVNHHATHSRLKAWPGSTDVIGDTITAVESAGKKLYQRMGNVIGDYAKYSKHISLWEISCIAQEKLQQFIDANMPTQNGRTCWTGSINTVIQRAIRRKD